MTKAKGKAQAKQQLQSDLPRIMQIIAENKLDTERKYTLFRNRHPELNLPHSSDVFMACYLTPGVGSKMRITKSDRRFLDTVVRS